MATLRKIWQAFRGVDRRQLQFEIDVHRLFLLTSYERQVSEDVDAITDLGEKLSTEDQQRSVQESVHQQIASIGEALDNILLEEPAKKNSDLDAPKIRPSGLNFAIGSHPRKIEDPEALGPAKTHPLKLSEVSAALRNRIGYTLELRPSQVDHKDAGTGVFLSGEAGPGKVVAFYPGIIYSPPQYRYMPGYPRMDALNSYLISRYDGFIIDGQPWGCGGESRELWDGSGAKVEVSDTSTDDTSQRTANEDKKNRLWGSIFGAKEAHGARKGSILERRNPLALAHFINHPGSGTQPNVMLCPYDFIFTDPYLRPYIPNVHFDKDEDWEVRRRGLVWLYDRKGEKTSTNHSIIRTLVLVSTREVCNEELFLNYRLSNHKNWPAWYKPVDSEEDKRRWH